MLAGGGRIGKECGSEKRNRRTRAGPPVFVWRRVFGRIGGRSIVVVGVVALVIGSAGEGEGELFPALGGAAVDAEAAAVDGGGCGHGGGHGSGDFGLAASAAGDVKLV